MLTRSWSEIARRYTCNLARGHASRFSRSRTSYFNWGRAGCTASRGHQYNIRTNRREQLHRGHLRGRVRRAHPYPVAQSHGESIAGNSPDGAKPLDKRGSFADTDGHTIRVSEEESVVVKHRTPLGGTTPGTLGAQAREVIGASAVDTTGSPSHFGASAPGTTGSPSEFAGSTIHWIRGLLENQLEQQHHLVSMGHRHLGPTVSCVIIVGGRWIDNVRITRGHTSCY